MRLIILLSDALLTISLFFFEFENSEKDGSGYTCNKTKEFDTPIFDKENFDASCDNYASYEME